MARPGGSSCSSGKNIGNVAPLTAHAHCQKFARVPPVTISHEPFPQPFENYGSNCYKSTTGYGLSRARQSNHTHVRSNRTVAAAKKGGGQEDSTPRFASCQKHLGDVFQEDCRSDQAKVPTHLTAKHQNKPQERGRFASQSTAEAHLSWRIY